MNSRKLTGLTTGSAAGDSVNLGQVQASAFTFQGTDSGSANTYVIALTPTISAQAAGLRVAFVAANASTGASTLNAGGGADAVEYQGAALGGAEIRAGATIVCEHDGTAWQMVSPSNLLTAGGGGGGWLGESGVPNGDSSDIIRINEQTLNNSQTMIATDNGSATGPLTIASGVTLTISSGATFAVI
jgi:hypothetical protein